MKNTMELVRYKDHTYQVPKVLKNAPYQFMSLTLWMDGLIPYPQDENGLRIENNPDGKGSIVFCMEHADIALLDSGVCQALIYRDEVSEPIWRIPLDREHCEILLKSGPDRCNFIFKTPVMEWVPDGYFVVFTNITTQYGYEEIMSCSEVSFVIDNYTPSYQASKEWKNIETVSVTCEDGEYLVPAESGEERANIYSINIDDEYGDNIRLISGEKKSLRIEANFDKEDEYIDVLIGLYRVGEKNPLWTVREMIPTIENVDVNTWVLDLTPGRYFILLSKVDVPGGVWIPFTHLGDCLRHDFTIIPDGNGLTHPVIESGVVTPLTSDIYEVYMNEGYVSAPCAKIELTFGEPFDATNNIICVRCYDESGEWIAECDDARNGEKNILECFTPFVDGNYRMEITHNGALFKQGHFTIENGQPSNVSIHD